MVLSADGDHPMTKLSDTQLVILSAAAQRADLSVLPLPDSLTLKGGALNKVMDSLRNRGLIRVFGGDGGPERVVLTSEGMAAIGVEPEGEEEPTGTGADALSPDTAPPAAGADSAAETPRRPPARPTARPRRRRAGGPRERARRLPRPRRPAASPGQRPAVSRARSPRRAPAPSRP
jgi:hypothetical protein